MLENKFDCQNPYYDYKRRDVVEYRIEERYPYREGTFMVRKERRNGESSAYTITDPDYGKKEE